MARMPNGAQAFPPKIKNKKLVRNPDPEQDSTFEMADSGATRRSGGAARGYSDANGVSSGGMSAGFVMALVILVPCFLCGLIWYVVEGGVGESPMFVVPEAAASTGPDKCSFSDMSRVEAKLDRLVQLVEVLSKEMTSLRGRCSLVET